MKIQFDPNLEYQQEADDLMRVVFRNNGFKDAKVKNNAIQVLRQSGIDNVKSLEIMIEYWRV